MLIFRAWATCGVMIQPTASKCRKILITNFLELSCIQLDPLHHSKSGSSMTVRCLDIFKSKCDLPVRCSDSLSTWFPGRRSEPPKSIIKRGSVSSACNWRRHWPECVGRVNGAFCFTGASYKAQLLRGRLLLNPGFFFFLKKHFSVNFICYYSWEFLVGLCHPVF